MIQFLKRIKLKFFGGYNAQKYWKTRHKEFGLDFRGVGNKALSAQENLAQYNEAKKIFCELIAAEKVLVKGAKVLDVGCGNGFYAKTYQELAIDDYTGIDITDTLFEELKQTFPDYSFEVLDVTAKPINEKYDLISMIDVTQHITNSKKFSYSMHNIKNALKANGVFIVTSWLDENSRDSPYEKSRSIKHYEKEFPGYVFSQPIPFRDKFIFTISK